MLQQAKTLLEAQVSELQSKCFTLESSIATLDAQLSTHQSIVANLRREQIELESQFAAKVGCMQSNMLYAVGCSLVCCGLAAAV